MKSTRLQVEFTGLPECGMYGIHGNSAKRIDLPDAKN
jgi:hypothetical protein